MTSPTAHSAEAHDSGLDGDRSVPASEVSRLLQDLTNLLQPLTGYAEMVASGILPADRMPEALRAIKEASTALVERMHAARAELLSNGSSGR